MTNLNVKFLEELCEAFGPSGHEEDAQKVARGYAKGYAFRN